MKRTLCIFIILLTSASISEITYAESNDIPNQYEDFYLGIGYQSSEKALKAFENHLKQDVKLPLRLPSIAFTHQFGRFINLEGDVNDSFEVKYINDKLPENHYKIDIRLVENGFQLRDHNILNTYELRDGNKASYLKIFGFNLLVFNKDNFQYVLSIDKRIENEVTPENLVEIANSMDYSHNKIK
ncbi:hypothetical protein [Peribacillus alkalitolerans]|uniref:hypothetical protein n=1 Tax=Peribacillus alkalitolerans TaxID=1550385 RepID=UPI001F0736A3|nr:hypothetical protein [Peribacillus alkalitolerans]